MLSELDLAALRARRRRLTDEHARLTWLRRLVRARGDLEVARLAGVSAPTDDDASLLTPVVQAALALTGDGQHDVPGSTLLTELVRTERTLTHAAEVAQLHLDEATAELLRRYRHDPTTCLEQPLVGEPAAS
ncbi:MAG TPA: hypothetical protein VFL94_09665 [Actinomycetales bacterium]|nr:hypothetical protein [Actinomycetales bacterium]